MKRIPKSTVFGARFRGYSQSKNSGWILVAWIILAYVLCLMPEPVYWEGRLESLQEEQFQSENDKIAEFIEPATPDDRSQGLGEQRELQFQIADAILNDPGKTKDLWTHFVLMGGIGFCLMRLCRRPQVMEGRGRTFHQVPINNQQPIIKPALAGMLGAVFFRWGCLSFDRAFAGTVARIIRAWFRDQRYLVFTGAACSAHCWGE